MATRGVCSVYLKALREVSPTGCNICLCKDTFTNQIKILLKKAPKQEAVPQQPEVLGLGFSPSSGVFHDKSGLPLSRGVNPEV